MMDDQIIRECESFGMPKRDFDFHNELESFIEGNYPELLYDFIEEEPSEFLVTWLENKSPIHYDNSVHMYESYLDETKNTSRFNDYCKDQFDKRYCR